MRGFHLIASFVIVGLLIAGCEKKDETNTTSGASKSVGDAARDAGQKASDTMAGAADKAKEMGSAAVAEAQKMIDQVKTYINEKKFSDAESLLSKLDGMRAQLPQNIQKMIDDCKSMLDKAKASMK